MTPDELKTVEEAAKLLSDYQHVYSTKFGQLSTRHIPQTLEYGDRIFVTRTKLEEMSRKERKNGTTTP